MSTFDIIYEIAADQYGLITAEEARISGIPNIELVKLAHRGRIQRVGHGVYRLSRYIPTPYDRYAEAVKLVGSDAYLYGASVLALHGLIPTNPSMIYVASARRIRKRLPEFICLVSTKAASDPVYYEGIPSQPVIQAISTCVGSIMTDRLQDAIQEALRSGLVTASEARKLTKELQHAKQTPQQ